MTTLLVTGGSSYLGQHLLPLSSAGFDSHYTFYEHDLAISLPGHRLDVRDETAVARLITQLKPAIIIHTVGSNRPSDMEGVITKGTANVTAAAQVIGARLIHISTDVVFDGRHAPYDESAQPAPLHAYGQAKAQAETLVAAHDNSVIVRTSLIYGLQDMDRGTAWMAQALRAGQDVTLFTDQLRNPVWVKTLCSACLELAGSDYRGILNVAGEQVLSRAEFGLRMLEWWGIAERETLSLGHSDPARWPPDCTLELTRARALLATPLLGVDAVLQAAAARSF